MPSPPSALDTLSAAYSSLERTGSATSGKLVNVNAPSQPQNPTAGVTPSLGNTGAPVPPSLVRRSSYEPLRLGLSSLPPPNFSKAPPGQRSVPATEFLANNGDSSGSTGRDPTGVSNGSDGSTSVSAVGNGSTSNSSSSLPTTVVGSATTVGLGNGVMSTEPWNLWSDPSAPAATAAATAAAMSSSNDLLNDEQLANALASKVALAGGNGIASTSPERVIKPASESDLGVPTSGAKNTSIQRNVSFSSLLDLPNVASEVMPHDAPSSSVGSSSSSHSGAGGSPLHRTTSLTRRSNASASSPTATKTTLPTSLMPTQLPGNTSVVGGNDSLSLPSLAFSDSTISLSPNQEFSSKVEMDARKFANRKPSNPFAGMEFTYMGSEDDGNAFGYGMNPFGGAPNGRSRQPTASSIGGFSDGSITSVPFGPFPGSDFFGDANAHSPFGSPAIYNGSRRDSSFGSSIYNASPSMPYGANAARGRANWQSNGPYDSPQLGRSMTPYTYMPPPPPEPYGNTAFGGVPGDHGYGSVGGNGLKSSPSGSSPSSSLYRYPASNTSVGTGDYVSQLSSLSSLGSGYGLGLVGPASPYSSLPMGNGGYRGPSYWDRPSREEKSRPIRSPLLEEFRADRSKRWGVQDMVGHVAEFMCDQVGSRYLQEHVLEHPSQTDCDLIYEEVCPVILQLSVDVFANFCVQRLLEKASEEQVNSMAKALKGSVLRLALQTYGCRVVQKAIEVVSPENQIMILSELEGSVQKCVRDQNANHVIQKIIQTVPADQLQFIIDAFAGHVYSFATHPYSCRVLQRILENCPERMTRPLLEELKSYAQNLMQDQYGNYVVQFVLEKGAPDDKSDIISQIYGQVLHLSKHKFASNVIEKCIMNATETEIQIIATEVLTPRVDGSTGVTAMLKHEYANYPLQRLIKHTHGPMHAAIVDQVGQQLALFKIMVPPFSAKHLVAVEKLLADIAPFPQRHAGYAGVMPHEASLQMPRHYY